MKKMMNQLKVMYQNTFDFKGVSSLNQCAYALFLQLLLLMATVLIVLTSFVTIISPNVVYIFLGIFIVNILPLSSLIIRRLRDAGIHLLQLLVVPMSYLLMGVIYSVRLLSSSNIYPLLMMLVFFLSHFYIIMLLLLPSKEV